MKTLLVIDMQNAWLANPHAPCRDAQTVVARTSDRPHLDAAVIIGHHNWM